jgi:hypothetical protein
LADAKSDDGGILADGDGAQPAPASTKRLAAAARRTEIPERMQLRSDTAAAARGTATGRRAALERAASGMRLRSGTVLAVDQAEPCGDCDGWHTWRPVPTAPCGNCDPRSSQVKF